MPRPGPAIVAGSMLLAAVAAGAAPTCEDGLPLGNGNWLTVRSTSERIRPPSQEGWSCETEIHVQQTRGNEPENAYLRYPVDQTDSGFTANFDMIASELALPAGQWWTIARLELATFVEGAKPALSLHLGSIRLGDGLTQALFIEWPASDPQSTIHPNKLQVAPLDRSMTTISLDWQGQDDAESGELLVTVGTDQFRYFVDPNGASGTPQQFDIGLVDSTQSPKPGDGLLFGNIALTIE